MNFQYVEVYKWENLIYAWKKARKGKTRKEYVREFEENLIENLQRIQFELMTFTYQPRPLIHFILRDPKTRKISKSDFRDRIIHHALINIIENIFEKSFFVSNCANQKGKGSLFAINLFDNYARKVSKNNSNSCFVLKADIKHYFREINHDVFLDILIRKICDENIIWLIGQIIKSREREREMGHNQILKVCH